MKRSCMSGSAPWGSRFTMCTSRKAEGAIALDPDINIYDPRDVHYAIATRGDRSRDVTIIGNARGFMFDPSAHPVLAASPDAAATRLPSVVGKWGIDATKPVPYRAAERKNYERAWPIAWADVKLEDYL